MEEERWTAVALHHRVFSEELGSIDLDEIRTSDETTIGGDNHIGFQEYLRINALFYVAQYHQQRDPPHRSQGLYHREVLWLLLDASYSTAACALLVTLGTDEYALT